MSYANRGRAFESLIEAANQQYKITGLAAVEKQEIQKKQIGGRLIYAQKGPPDFMGAVRGGTAIAFDAKSTRKKSLPIDMLTSRQHQLDFLKHYDNLGAYAFYLVEFAEEGRAFMLPIGQALKFIERAKNGGRKSINISEFEIELKSTWQNALDYLEPLGIKGA